MFRCWQQKLFVVMLRYHFTAMDANTCICHSFLKRKLSKVNKTKLLQHNIKGFQRVNDKND